MSSKSKGGNGIVHIVPSQVSRIPGDPVEIYTGLTRLTSDCARLMKFCEGTRDEDGRWRRPPDSKGWALAIREMRGILDQQARMVGAYDSVNPKFQNPFVGKFIDAVTKALADHPEAQTRVVAAIKEIEEE